MKTHKEYSMITVEEEHDAQFASKKQALQVAKLLTVTTHKKHQVIFTTTYRDLIRRTCWTVVLQLGWQSGKLVTI